MNNLIKEILSFEYVLESIKPKNGTRKHQQNEDKMNINSDEISFGKNCLLFHITMKPKSKWNEGKKKTKHWTHIKQLSGSVSSMKHEVKFTWKIYNGLNKTEYGKRARAK